MIIGHACPAKSTRRHLVEWSETPFTPTEDVRPVVYVMGGCPTNDEIEPEDRVRSLEGAVGRVAIYFELLADHER
ncbi:hypothetical protein [Natrialba swarupiae]|uniref:Uncharacterized protein n=1 Tax=Natrialba swarupiae TaxID=2448032 RepID=A0A5D5AF43_9EURY|nr:hypothetical protein [Natrialba swarupiae]TYT60409.1 hypothetical protein FYC77_19040 [Natrialba swarupiae]